MSDDRQRWAQELRYWRCPIHKKLLVEGWLITNVQTVTRLMCSLPGCRLSIGLDSKGTPTNFSEVVLVVHEPPEFRGLTSDESILESIARAASDEGKNASEDADRVQHHALPGSQRDEQGGG